MRKKKRMQEANYEDSAISWKWLYEIFLGKHEEVKHSVTTGISERSKFD